jgi:signal transduction histidine kinase
LLLPNGLEQEGITRRSLEVIAAASDELQELVDNLLDATKISAGALDVHPAPVRLRPLALAAVERVRPRAVRHDFCVSVGNRLPAVYADPRRIEQVLYNLLDNAIKYSPERGRITVAAEAGAAEVCVGVADQGIGIPTDLLAGLFERFRREATARTRGIAGTGLGLAICKGIVEAHGGRIWAASPASGRRSGVRPGAVVRFTLPTVPLAAWGSSGLAGLTHGVPA